MVSLRKCTEPSAMPKWAPPGCSLPGRLEKVIVDAARRTVAGVFVLGRRRKERRHASQRPAVVARTIVKRPAFGAWLGRKPLQLADHDGVRQAVADVGGRCRVVGSKDADMCGWGARNRVPNEAMVVRDGVCPAVPAADAAAVVGAAAPPIGEQHRRVFRPNLAAAAGAVERPDVGCCHDGIPRDRFSEVPLGLEIGIFDIGQNGEHPTGAVHAGRCCVASLGPRVVTLPAAGAGVGGGRRNNAAGRKDPVSLGVIVQSKSDLLQLAATLGPTRGFAGRLNGRQQQGYQHADDRDDHQKFHQAEAASGKHDRHP